VRAPTRQPRSPSPRTVSITTAVWSLVAQYPGRSTTPSERVIVSRSRSPRFAESGEPCDAPSPGALPYVGGGVSLSFQNLDARPNLPASFMRYTGRIDFGETITANHRQHTPARPRRRRTGAELCFVGVGPARAGRGLITNSHDSTTTSCSADPAAISANAKKWPRRKDWAVQRWLAKAFESASPAPASFASPSAIHYSAPSAGHRADLRSTRTEPQPPSQRTCTNHPSRAAPMLSSQPKALPGCSALSRVSGTAWHGFHEAGRRNALKRAMSRNSCEVALRRNVVPLRRPAGRPRLMEDACCGAL